MIYEYNNGDSECITWNLSKEAGNAWLQHFKNTFGPPHSGGLIPNTLTEALVDVSVNSTTPIIYYNDDEPNNK